ncbi:bifunctional helix-turn-helix transcriptional regulator/GNAT family N-acetyltransferase [Jiangella mangrovi]|uniref:DNA-binding MarR family transcriptional regulator/GNAT superfamily N-acetyltransferase n=1 Tax=Jiangella mangrovi TaxID=1524084 RepID=A0A7W9GP14_9ACTN|nr:bifunctional helix-turn-helix transcriptional regulator/GNAT family N-acetyltransferase [Jiangella mangrovi]MBB5787430.1 DNA-binding MarR family transcriptional regulator/GNAT superfamily N-acetyltransferase [Jiangella mangrovi]
MTEVQRDQVAAVRQFNRFYTRVMGFLDQELLRSGFSLTEARIVFELGQRDVTEVGELRAALDVDAAQLSRTLARFEAAGLIERTRSAADGRKLLAALTDAGRAARADLVDRSDRQAKHLLDALPEADRRRLVADLDSVRRLLSESERPRTVVVRGLRPGDLGWVVQRNAVLYAQEYGWDRSYEGLVARIVADYVEHHDPARENAWVAELDGRPVGAVFCVRKDETTAQLRLLLVDPDARGAGIGTRLVAECLEFARAAGYASMILWTNDVLVAARRIYQKAGFELVEENRHHSFGHDLVGQIWRLQL